MTGARQLSASSAAAEVQQDESSVGRDFFQVDPLVCARSMIGCELVWGDTAGIIVETEAYAAVGDQAAHTFMRALARSFVQEKLPGTLYVYLNYGMHWLLNFLVKGPEEYGFVLVRALQPTRGIATMQQRRKCLTEKKLCSGPGKLTQALGIDGTSHGIDFFGLRDVVLQKRQLPVLVEVDRRIGITKSAHLEWRFLLAESSFVSVRKRKTRLRTG